MVKWRTREAGPSRWHPKGQSETWPDIDYLPEELELMAKIRAEVDVPELRTAAINQLDTIHEMKALLNGRFEMGKAEERYEEMFGPDKLAEQRELAASFWLCCAEPKSGPHHPSCAKYVTKKTEVVDGQTSLL